MNRPRPETWNITAELFPVVGGHRNTVFRTKGLPRDVVFKSTRRSSAALAWLGQVQQHARNAGFIVPQLIKSHNGRLIEDCWTCETFINGAHIDPAELPDIRPDLLKFHTAASDLPQRPGFLSSGELLHVSAGGDVDLNQMPDHIARKCREAWHAVAGRQEGIIHGDLNTGNVLRAPNGAIALIDWDESRRDLVLFDLGQIEADDDAGAQARLAWEIACCWTIEPAHAMTLVARL